MISYLIQKTKFIYIDLYILILKIIINLLIELY